MIICLGDLLEVLVTRNIAGRRKRGFAVERANIAVLTPKAGALEISLPGHATLVAVRSGALPRRVEVSARGFGALLSSLARGADPELEVDFEITDAELIVRAGRLKTTLKLMDSETG